MAVATYQDQATGDTGELRWLALDEIAPADDNPRTTLTGIEELADSIRADGVLTPILVEETDGRYRLAAGSRRYAAARLAGLTHVPALVKSMDAVTRKTAQLTENTQVPLTPAEEAAGYQELLALGAEPETLARRVGRPKDEVDGRLAVNALPQAVHDLLSGGKLDYAEALLLTGLAEHEDDVIRAARMCATQGWDITAAVRTVQRDRERIDREDKTRAALMARKVAIVDLPEEYGNARGNAPRRLGTGYGTVHIKHAAHRRQPCHAAAIGFDGSAVYVCTDPQRHAGEPGSGVERAPDVRAQRAQTRAENRRLREASAARKAAAAAWVPAATDVTDPDVLQFVLTNVLVTAPHDAITPALALLGIEPENGWDGERTALMRHAAADLGSALTAVLAVQCAAAERDASAKYDRALSGRTVIAYLDMLAHAGYDELPGDQALRDRFVHITRAVQMDEDTGEAGTDGGTG
jgi:ParB/RepB/Spo0J family partition protein